MITLVLVKNPFAPQDGREVEQIEYAGTLEELLTAHPVENTTLQATVNGFSVPEDTLLKNGDFVVIYPVIEKGGKGGKSILALVAAVALSVVSMGVGGYAATGVWGSFAGASAATVAWNMGLAALIMFAGNTLIGRFMGQKADMGDYGTETSDPTYSWGGVQTMEGQNNAIPLTYGKIKSGGQTIGKYISSNNSDKEYLNWLVAAGEGELSISDVKLNDNDIENFDGVSSEIRRGTNDQTVISNFNDTYFTKNVSYSLNDTDWHQDVAQGDATQGLVISVDFPHGLYHVKDNGQLEDATVVLDIEYKKTGATAWVNMLKEVSANSFGVSLRNNVGAGAYNIKISKEMKKFFQDGESMGESWTGRYLITIGGSTTSLKRKQMGTSVNVGNFSVDTSAWSNAIKENGGSGTITVTAGAASSVVKDAKSSAVHKQFRVNHIPIGEYDVRVRVKSRQYPVNDNRSATACTWTGITSIVYDDFTYPCTALVGIKALATKQLNGSPTLSFIKERSSVWVWNGSAYVSRPANNPAWAAYDFIHQARKIKNINSGNYEFEVRGAKKELMRYEDFAAWANWCQQKRLYVNMEVTGSGEMLEMVNKQIANIGHGMIVRFGTKYGCIYDHVQDPVMMFGMGNIIAGTFQEKFLEVNDRANCVEVTYTDANRDYERNVLTVYGDTYNTDGYQKTAQLTMNGITDYEQAYREGVYQLECNKRQLRTVTFEASIDAIACTVGDVVLIAHDVPKWANSGRIFEINGKEMVLPVEVSDTTQNYRIQYRTVKDKLYTCPVNILSSADDWTTVEIEDGINESDPPQAGDVFDLAIATIGSKPFVVRGITRAQDFTRTLTCVEYDEALFNEDYDIPPIEYATPAVKTAQNVRNLTASQWRYTDSSRVKHGVLDVSWGRPSNGGKFNVLLSRDNKRTWSIGAAGVTDTSVSLSVPPGNTYYVKVITVLGLGQSKGVITGPVAPGKDLLPSDVTGLRAALNPNDRTQAELTWDTNTDVDFNHYEVTVGGKAHRTASNVITVIAEEDNAAIAVVAIDNEGQKSGTPAGVTVPFRIHPSNVAGFAVAQQDTNRAALNLSWNAVTDTDLGQYEVRAGDTWQNGVLVAKTKTLKTTYTVTQSGFFKFWISAINNAGNYSLQAVSVSRNINIVPDVVTNLTVTQNSKDRSKGVISFTPPAGNDIAYYLIKQGSTEWQTKELSTVIDLPGTGTFAYSVQAVAVSGAKSNAVTTSITCSVMADDVMDFRVTPSATNRTKVMLSWSAANAPDVAYYIIKEGASWETGIVVAERVSMTRLEVTVTDENTHTWLIKAVTTAGHESQFAASVGGVFAMQPTPVAAIQAAQSPIDRSVLMINWSEVPDGDLAGYEVRIGSDWNSGEPLPFTRELYQEYVLAKSDTFNIMIKSRNTAGFYSDETSITATVKVEPADVTGLVVYKNGDSIDLYWDKVEEAGIAGYELREGFSWEDATVISTGIPNTNFTHEIATERLYKYWVKAINSNGHCSVRAAGASISVTELMPRNIIFTYDEIALNNGTHSNTEVGASTYTWQTFGGRFSDYPTTRFSETGSSTVLKLLKGTDNLYPAAGEYLPQMIDIGSIITCYVSVLFTSTATLRGGTVKLEIQTSQDSTKWTAWEIFKPVQRTFRYLKLRVSLGTNNPAETPEVTQFIVSMDVPDTDIAITRSIAQGGATVNYGHTFFSVPVVIPAALGENLHAELISKTKTACVVKIKDRNNVDVGGNADIRIKGY